MILTCLDRAKRHSGGLKLVYRMTFGGTWEDYPFESDSVSRVREQFANKLTSNDINILLAYEREFTTEQVH